ncbi:MAG TPA: PEGA domain-containing protein [Kofleriaceae bacterium]
MVVVVGKATAHQREIVGNTVRFTAEKFGWQFRAIVLDGVDAQAPSNCLKAVKPWPCLLAGVGQPKTDQVVVVEVGPESAAKDAATVLTMHVLTPYLASEVQASKYCDQCADDGALVAGANELALRLLRDAATGGGRTLLSIRSRPDKAWIVLDGNQAGSTNATKPTYPGEHIVTVNRSGYKTGIGKVDALEGKTTEIDLALEPLPGTEHDRNPAGQPLASPSHLWSTVAFSGGATVLAAGVVLIAVDEDPSTKGQRHMYYYNTAPLGVGLTVAGAAAVGLGFYLRHRENEPASTVTVAPIPGGAAASWQGRF